MANRAYLFCSESDPDNPLTWAECRTNEQPYYDSRHGIPLAWLFFFQPGDCKLIDVSYNQSHWQEPKLMSDKTQAIDYFKQKQAVLAELVGPRFYGTALDRFLPALQQMPGDCLCMDPAEVIEDEGYYLLFCQIAELIADKATPKTVLKEALGQFGFLTFKDDYEFALYVFGATYW